MFWAWEVVRLSLAYASSIVYVANPGLRPSLYAFTVYDG